MKTIKYTIVALALLTVASAQTTTPTPTPASLVIPAPTVRTVQQVAPISFQIPAAQVPNFISALFSSLSVAGAEMPTLPAGVQLTAIQARILPTGNAQVMVQFTKQ